MIKHLYYYLVSIFYSIKYKPTRVSLINDKFKYNRYGHLKYEIESEKYPHYNSFRYFKYPFPLWLNKIYDKKYERRKHSH